jgi:hypothetical protein
MRTLRRTGSVERPAGSKRGPASKLTPQLRERMGAWIEAQPDLTLAELQLRQTHAETSCQHGQTAVAALIGLEKFTTQIVRVGACHPCSRKDYQSALYYLRKWCLLFRNLSMTGIRSQRDGGSLLSPHRPLWRSGARSTGVRTLASTSTGYSIGEFRRFRVVRVNERLAIRP